VALQIARGLQAAHRAGIYHHDLKPANLLLKRIKSLKGITSVEVKIIDFGLARACESLADHALSAQHNSGLSMLGQDIFGTFDYAPPEQQGSKEFGEPGPKSDVYSLGATLYKLFTNENPRSPRERKLPESSGLRDLIMDCLEHRQEQRPELEALIQALQGMLEQRKSKAEAEKSARKQAEAKRKAEKAAAARRKKEAEKSVREQAEAKRKAEKSEARLSGEGEKRPRKTLRAIAAAVLLLIGAGIYLGGGDVIPPKNNIPEKTAEEKAKQARLAQQEAKAAEKKAEQARLAQQEAKAAEEKAEAAAKAEQERLAKLEASAKAQRDITAKKQLEKLLAQCRIHLNADSLTTGRNGTALKCYRQVLADDPDNERARAGLQEIQEKYAGWAENALRSEQWGKAKKHLERMGQVDETSDIFKQTRTALADAYVGHARTTLREEDWSAAENGLRRLAALDGEDARLAELREELRKGRETQQVKPAGNSWTEPVTGMEFVKIPGACFQMGSPESEKGRFDNEKPHRVCVKDFWLAKTEVTNAQYRKFKRDHNSKEFAGHSLNGAKQPAVYVSWQDAMKFIDWLNRQGKEKYRLPTEAEWEYAARAGTKTAYYWGDKPDDACRYANVHDLISKRENKFDWTHHNCEDGYAVTAPAGSFRPNKFGLYDMLGNVWEWTCSEWDSNYGGEEKRCSSKNHVNGNRVFCGGSWDNIPRDVRSAVRDSWKPDNRYNKLGFRPARIK
ncbi:MAG: SUMF1/EgtB/PvdO family nonheme iron enzyme, partial [Gammaproteobacteria bacterium]|nr:SUMF1/EgtB/PvdO family nonheme iron enzyme [Gammaproteobacteria bacterium]